MIISFHIFFVLFPPPSDFVFVGVSSSMRSAVNQSINQPPPKAKQRDERIRESSRRRHPLRKGICLMFFVTWSFHLKICDVNRATLQEQHSINYIQGPASRPLALLLYLFNQSFILRSFTGFSSSIRLNVYSARPAARTLFTVRI